MSEDQKRILERQLWGVANVLRGKMNADEYKTISLALFSTNIFLKSWSCM